MFRCFTPSLRLLLWATIGVGLGVSSSASAQFGDEEPVAVEARWTPLPTAPGHPVTLEVTVKASPGWHVYGPAQNENVIPSRVTVEIPEEHREALKPAGEWVWPEPRRKKATPGVEPYDYYKGTVKLTRKFHIAHKANQALSANVKFYFQACTDEMCLAPNEIPAAVPLPLVGLDTKKSQPFEQREKVDFDNPEVIGRGLAGVEPGRSFDLQVQFVNEPGWYIYGTQQNEEYGIPTAITVKDAGPFSFAGSVREPLPKVVDDPAMGGELLKHLGKPVFFVPFEAPAGVAAGKHTVKLEAYYTTCKDVCLAPQTIPLALEVWVGPAPGTDETESAQYKTRYVHPEGRLELSIDPVGGIVPGESFELVVKAKMPPGWHTYSFENETWAQATQIELSSEGTFKFPEGKKPTEPKPKQHTIETDTHLIHDGSMEFRIPVQTGSELEAGVYEVKGNYNGQVCHDDVGCVPVNFDFVVPVGIGVDAPRIEDAQAEGRVVGPEGPVRFTGSLDRSKARPGESVTLTLEGEVVAGKRIPAIGSAADDVAKKGLLGIVWASIVGALIALLTPCVYPMIPITISVFTKQAESRHTNVFLLAVIFCAGIIVTFTGIGLLLSVTLGKAGATLFATHWAVNFGIGLLFLWFAGSLFGYYDIQLPSWLTSRATGAGSSGGIASVILMGLVFSVTSFTCVGPIVGSLLLVAVTGGVWYATVGMLAFSATFAFPFFLLALFPKALSGLPKSGGWLNSVKVVLGFVEVAAAFKFFCVVSLFWGINLLPREIVLAIWGIVFLATVIYLFGWIKFPHDSPVKKIGVVRVAVILLFAVFSGYCFWGASGRLVNSNLEAQLSPSLPYFEAWRKKAGFGIDYTILSSESPLDYNEVMAELKTSNSGKPIFINFTGHT